MHVNMQGLFESAVGAFSLTITLWVKSSGSTGFSAKNIP